MTDRSLKLEVILAAIDKATGPIKAVMAGSKGLSSAVKEAKDRLKELEQQNKRLENFRQVARDVAVTGNAMAAAQGKVKELAQQIRATDQPSKAMLRNFEAAKREAAQLKDRHQALTQQQQRLRTELQAAGVPLQGMARHQAELRRKIDEAAGAVNRQTEALKRQGEQMRRLQSAREAYDKTMNTRNKLAGAGAGMAAAGGGALYAGARLAGTGIDFGAAMSRVQALAQLEKTSEEFVALRKQARELGAATSFTATQAAEAQGFLAMAGFKSRQILDAMPGMLDLSKAGGTDLQRTADIASNILSAFGLEAREMGRVGDVLTKTFTSSNVSLETLADTMKYVAPVARAAGMSLEQASAMAGMLGNIGLQGSMSGTALRAMNLRLAGPPKAAREALEELKITTKDAHGNLRQIPEVLLDIAKATQKLGTADRIAYLKAIFGEEAAAGMTDLVERGGTGELQKYIDLMKRAEGTSAKAAKIMADNARGDLLSLQSAWEDVQISLFDTNEGPLRSLIQTITGVVRAVGQWITANPELAATIVKAGAAAAALATGLGGLLLAASAVLGPFAMARYGLAAFGVFASKAIPFVTMLGKVALPAVGQALLWIGRALMANPIGLAVTGIALAAGLVYQHWEPIKAWFASIWDNVKQTTGQALEFFRGLPAQFAQFGADMMRGLADGIRNTFGAVKDAVGGAAQGAVDWVKEKLSINSPSRVFADIGGSTMEGFAAGINRGAGEPLDVIIKTARKLVAAGATAAAISGPALAGSPATADGLFEAPLIDSRPPISAVAPQSRPAEQVVMNYTVNITAGAGADMGTLRALFREELDRHKREVESRQRSRLADFE